MLILCLFYLKSHYVVRQINNGIKKLKYQLYMLAFSGIKHYHDRPFRLNLIQRKSIITRVCHEMSELQQNKEKQQKAANPSPAANYLLLSAGSIFTSMLIAGFLVGYGLDQVFETTPIFMLSCGVLGFIGGMQKIHKLTSRLNNVKPVNQEKQDSEKS